MNLTCHSPVARKRTAAIFLAQTHSSHHMDTEPSAIPALARRGEGYGVKGSRYIVFWPHLLTYELGVLLGMLYGDGHLVSRRGAKEAGKWRIEFCEGDREIIESYVRLTKSLFNLKPIVRQRENWWDAYYCSRIAYEWLTSAGEHPTGKKLGKLLLPRITRENDDILRGFTCGLFSVEGSVKLGKYLRITLEMLEPRLVKDVFETLQSNGISAHIYHYDKGAKAMYGTYVYGKADAALFLPRFGLLGNKREKLASFLTSGKVTAPARKQPGGGAIRRV